jgi:UDP-N-acetylmuramoyl-L-alanyl-D-glutamate--2,6-diaminopimelate ligase
MEDKRMLISKLIEGLEDVEYIGEDIEINKLCYSTTQVTEECLFFCIVGVKTDGHNFAKEAAQKGAKALVISHDVEIGDTKVSLIRTKDTRKAMALISANFYGNPSHKLDIVGITGTNGKTTSTFMLRSILSACGRKSGLMGTIYNIVGEKSEEAKRTTPESMDLQAMLNEMVEAGDDSCIMEVSSHSLALERVYGLNFAVGIFTNLTQDHLDYHVTMENYFQAKMKLFVNCRRAVINIDDEYGKRACKIVSGEVITFGIENPADVWAEDIVIDGTGTNFILCAEGKKLPVRLHLPGKFNVYNALGVTAAAISLGATLENIKMGLEGLLSVPGRSEKVNSKKGFTIVIDYAHSPDGIVNILKAAREYTANRLITVFGCGGDRDRTKRPIMGKAAGEGSDFCVVTSDNPRSEDPDAIIREIMPGLLPTGCPHQVITNRHEAIEYAIGMGKPGDVIVIAGKGHETYQILKDRTIDFDERKIVHEILGDDLA